MIALSDGMAYEVVQSGTPVEPVKLPPEMPAEQAAEIKATEKALPGLERISCSLPLGTPLSVAVEQLERFAKEVMPAFKGAKANAAE